MGKKLLFFDIDGTLLSEGKERYIPQSAIDAVRAARKNGHYAFVNTGRCISELDDVILGMDFDGLVCGCGTYILYRDEVVFHYTPETAVRKEVVSDLNSCGLEGLLEGERCIYYGRQPYVSRMEIIRREHFKMMPERIQDMNEGIPDFDKFCFCIKDGCDFEAFYQKYREKFTFIDRGRNFYEVVPSCCSKASGMEYLMKYLQAGKEDIIAFGDSTNDVEMLVFAHTGIVMGKHDKEVEAYADYITDTLESDGIAKALQHFNLI